MSHQTPFLTLLVTTALVAFAPAADAATVGPNTIAAGEAWSHVIEGRGTLGFHIHPSGNVHQVEVPADSDGTTQTVTVTINADGDGFAFDPAEPQIEQGDTIEFTNAADEPVDLMLFTPSGGTETHDHDGHDHPDDDTTESPTVGTALLLALVGVAAMTLRRR